MMLTVNMVIGNLSEIVVLVTLTTTVLVVGLQLMILLLTLHAAACLVTLSNYGTCAATAMVALVKLKSTVVCMTPNATILHVLFNVCCACGDNRDN